MPLIEQHPPACHTRGLQCCMSTLHLGSPPAAPAGRAGAQCGALGEGAGSRAWDPAAAADLRPGGAGGQSPTGGDKQHCSEQQLCLPAHPSAGDGCCACCTTARLSQRLDLAARHVAPYGHACSAAHVLPTLGLCGLSHQLRLRAAAGLWRRPVSSGGPCASRRRGEATASPWQQEPRRGRSQPAAPAR